MLIVTARATATTATTATTSSPHQRAVVRHAGGQPLVGHSQFGAWASAASARASAAATCR
ncbi:hypothetical protein M2161_000549 [Streptomyces sp. SAI-133]|nr:hypothetical protein [Streptomyces sp. SAI-133]